MEFEGCGRCSVVCVRVAETETASSVPRVSSATLRANTLSRLCNTMSSSFVASWTKRKAAARQRSMKDGRGSESEAGRCVVCRLSQNSSSRLTPVEFDRHVGQTPVSSLVNKGVLKSLLQCGCKLRNRPRSFDMERAAKFMPTTKHSAILEQMYLDNKTSVRETVLWK